MKNAIKYGIVLSIIALEFTSVYCRYNRPATPERASALCTYYTPLTPQKELPEEAFTYLSLPPEEPGEYTEEERELMARVVMSEASILPFEGKVMVALTILNRVNSGGKFPDTVQKVVYQPNQYTVTAKHDDITVECYEAVDEAMSCNPYPTDLYYFRSGKAHDFAYQYAHIGNTYFSTEYDYGAVY